MKNYQLEQEKFWLDNVSKRTRLFIAYITDSLTGEQVVPSHVINTVSRPTRRWENDEQVWNDITIQLYETLGQNILMKLNTAKSFKLRVREFDHEGTIREEWELIDCRFENIYAHDLSWNQDDSPPMNLSCQVSYKSVRVNTNIERK